MSSMNTASGISAVDGQAMDVAAERFQCPLVRGVLFRRKRDVNRHARQMRQLAIGERRTHVTRQGDQFRH